MASVKCFLSEHLKDRDWTCSTEVLKFTGLKNYYHCCTSLRQIFGEINVSETAMICKLCVDNFTFRRGKSCKHPAHNENFTRGPLEPRRTYFVSLDDFFSRYRAIGLKPNEAICKRYCMKSAGTSTTEENSFLPPPSKKKLLQTLNDVQKSVDSTSPPVSFGKRNSSSQRNLVTRVVTDVGSKLQLQAAELNLVVPKQDPEALRQIKTDSDDLYSLMSCLKARLQNCNKSEIRSLLTIIPPSWTIEKASKYFDVSTTMVVSSRKLRANGEFLPKPINKLGKLISPETKAAVTDFYNSDDVSRACPGMKDVVSVKNLDTGLREKKQKRFLTLNVREMFQRFKEVNSMLSIGLSSFFSLRPKECVSLASKGYHNVCLCVHHENVKLLYRAIQKSSIKEFVSLLVCEVSQKQCYYRRCSNCQSYKVKLVTQLQSIVSESGSTSISYKRWLTTDGTHFVHEEMNADDFVEFTANETEKLLKHHFVSKSQQKYLNNIKDNLKEQELLVCGDFAENYAPVIQDSIQSEYFSHKSITLHPFHVYWRMNREIDGKLVNSLHSFAFCVISDCTLHDTNAVLAFQKHLLTRIKQQFQALNITIKTVHYFTDGCAAQYKNRKNFTNLFFHYQDFGLEAFWNFFATAHGKGPCDAHGGTSKRLVRLESERGAKIITALEMFQWLSLNVLNIEYLYVDQNNITATGEELGLSSRYDLLATIPGTRQAHRISVTKDRIMLFELSEDTIPVTTKMISFRSEIGSVTIDECSINDWIGCIYDKSWFMASILEVNLIDEEVKVSFWKANTQRHRGTSFVSENSSCWIPFGHVLKQISPTKSKNGRTMLLALDVQDELDILLLQHVET